MHKSEESYLFESSTLFPPVTCLFHAQKTRMNSENVKIHDGFGFRARVSEGGLPLKRLLTAVLKYTNRRRSDHNSVRGTSMGCLLLA